jgi:acetoin utilization deacetylase AcuC-like enzyme
MRIGGRNSARLTAVTRGARSERDLYVVASKEKHCRRGKARGFCLANEVASGAASLLVFGCKTIVIE